VKRSEKTFISFRFEAKKAKNLYFGRETKNVRKQNKAKNSVLILL
jgi:hypothetical protein